MHGYPLVELYFLRQSLNKNRLPELAYTQVQTFLDLRLYGGATRIRIRSRWVIGSTLSSDATSVPHLNYEY